MILLVERYTPDAARLWASMQAAGQKARLVCVANDGFLPQGALSPFSFMEPKGEPHPLYFNELALPHLWELRSSTVQGEIYDFEDLRGKVFYASPKVLRQVRIVDWYDRQGVARSSDHYDQYGRRFAQSILDGRARLQLRTYYDEEGREVLMENLVTGHILLQEKGRTQFFRSRVELLATFLRSIGAGEEQIAFTSLATCYPALRALRRAFPGQEDILLLSGTPEKESLPTLTSLLEEDPPVRILVQSRAAYERLRDLGMDLDRVKKLGFIYPFVRENGHRPHALIYTNSDQVLHLGELADALPALTFHVCAVTEMSPKLLSLGQKPNVRLYPGVSLKKAAALMEECDIYLDINLGTEILNAVETAFLHNLAILGFSNALHNPRYLPPSSVFDQEEYREMAEILQSALDDPGFFDDLVASQRDAAMTTGREQYRSLLGGEDQDERT